MTGKRQQHRDILIRPNSSLPRRWVWQVVVIISFPSVFLAIWLFAMGAWLVLPFALLQVGLIIWGFRKYRWRAAWRERIRIFDDKIIIERGHGRCEEKIELPRHWSRVALESPDDRLKPNRLVLRTGMQTCEVASCLTDSERIGLEARLHDLIGPVSHTPNI